MGNGKHGWHHAWHKILNTLVQKHHKDNLTYPTSKLEKKQFFLQSNFFKILILHTFLAACSHSQPLAVLAATRSPSQPLAATRSHSKPLAATRVAASGCKWPLQASGRKWPQVAAQVAASGRSQRVAASGRKWPLQPVPSEWPQVAASGRFLRFQFPPSKQPLWKYLYILYIYVWDTQTLCGSCNGMLMDLRTILFLVSPSRILLIFNAVNFLWHSSEPNASSISIHILNGTHFRCDVYIFAFSHIHQWRVAANWPVNGCRSAEWWSNSGMFFNGVNDDQLKYYNGL